MNPKGEITELLAKPKQKDGKMFAQVTSLKFINYNTDRVYYQLDNLFNGNKELGKISFQFLTWLCRESLVIVQIIDLELSSEISVLGAPEPKK